MSCVTALSSQRIFLVGSTSPLSFTLNSTVQWKPWCLANILASIGSACSLRYSCSAATKTTCFPLPGPSPPG